MDYFSDAEAAKEKNSENSGKWGKMVPTKTAQAQGKHGATSALTARMTRDECIAKYYTAGRNPRSVLSLASEPFSEAHFATFPPTLVYQLLLPSISKAGCCPACGCQYAPVVETKFRKLQETNNWNKTCDNPNNNRDCTTHPRGVNDSRVISYRPTCTCQAGEPVPPRVLDPFSGSATVGQVCQFMHADYTGIELNPEYIEMAKRRIVTPWKPKHLRTAKAKRKPTRGERALF
jgi:hypothetical protein